VSSHRLENRRTRNDDLVKAWRRCLWTWTIQPRSGTPLIAGSGIQVSLIEPGPIKSRIRANSYEKFHAHIEREHSPHREQYRAVEQRLLQEGSSQPSPQVVLRKLIHALESPRPKPRYYVTHITYLFGGLRRLLSSRRLDQVLTWTSDSGRR